MRVLAFVIAIVFFLGGMLLFGYAFEAPAAQAVIFFSGVIAVAVSLAVPFHILRGLDR